MNISIHPDPNHASRGAGSLLLICFKLLALAAGVLVGELAARLWIA